MAAATADDAPDGEGDEATRLNEATRVEEATRAYEAGLRLITFRDRAVHELRKRLWDKGFAHEAVESAIERLKQIGYLDDRALCERTIAGMLAVRPAGPRYITDRLRLKGVHPDLIREVIEQVYPDELVEETAYRAASARIGRYRNEEPIARRRKLAGFLARRGFSYGDVQKALRRVLAELDEDAPEEN